MKTKILNSELFGEAVSVERKPDKNRLLDSMKFKAPTEEFNLEMDLQISQKEITSLKTELQNLADSVTENQNNSKLRVDRLQMALTKLEQSHESLITETSEKLQHLNAKVNDQKKYDHKIQELIDRHNNLLKGYEIRMNQTQKILAQKESELVEVYALLNDTKMELSRLKRI